MATRYCLREIELSETRPWENIDSHHVYLKLAVKINYKYSNLYPERGQAKDHIRPGFFGRGPLATEADL